MTDKVTICNMAAGHIRAGSIASFEENSLLAKNCRLFYDQARREILEEFDWSFARKRVSLNLLVESPPDIWLYKYRFPSGMLKGRWIAYPGVRRPADPIAWDTELDDSGNGRVVLTDQESAILVGTMNVTNTALFTDLAIGATSWRLASYLAIPMAGRADDEKRCFDWSRWLGGLASVADANESQEDEEPDGEFVTGRL